MYGKNSRFGIMKKLLFVISQLYKGGAETSLVNLLNQLDYSKYSVDLIVLNQVPVKDVVSLLDKVNSNVCVCDAYEKSLHYSFFHLMKKKVLYTAEQNKDYPFSALEFVRNKKYDWAFFVGEWCSPAFVALEVEAERKAAWIHSDISKASYFDEKMYFEYLDRFDYFIFVSQHSLESSVDKYPFLKEKAVTIYNINDVENIKRQAEESVEDFPETDLPVLLTCANFREEKNHLRQVQVLGELKARGVDLIWVNIGATANKALVDKVRQECKKYGVENRFLILGPKTNPYKYIKKANAVTVLSDHESWSMVITEAKILGKVVISTKTSGGLEQIVDATTGLLTEFDVTSIADTIEKFIKDSDLRKRIETNVKNFDNTKQIIREFDELIEAKKESGRDILYIIDDVNYLGGAHVATKRQIAALMSQNRNITVFSKTIPNVRVRKELCGVTFLSVRDVKVDIMYKHRLFFCLLSNIYTQEEKNRKLFFTIKGYRKKLEYETDVLRFASDEFSKFEIVCVMSEASVFRKIVAGSNAKKKIQWIHTDYAVWRCFNEWTLKITNDDGKIYENFDEIVVLTQGIADRFASLYPHLRKKLKVSQNLLPVEEIKNKSEDVELKNEVPLHFVTVGRLGEEKEYPRLISVLKTLKEEGYNFTWTIVGGGDGFSQLRDLIQSSDLEKTVTMTGALKNPYPRMASADIFALLSRYEGLPNTIYESLILGVPVLATNVGGINEQIDDGKNGWLVDNNEDSIAEKIRYLLMNQNVVHEAKKTLTKYVYDNSQVIGKIDEIFNKD